MSSQIDYTTLGRRIRRLRLDRDMSQCTLGQETGMGSAAISNIELARGKPSLHQLRLIAIEFDTTIGDLLGTDVVRVKAGSPMDLKAWEFVEKDGGHWWGIYKEDGFQSCRICGNIRNLDKSTTCQGRKPITLRGDTLKLYTFSSDWRCPMK